MTVKELIDNPNSTPESIRDKHNKMIDSLPPEYEVYRIGKTPYEVMVEFLEGKNK